MPDTPVVSNYYITPVARVIDAADYRSAQTLARKLHPSGRALPIVATGVVVADDRPNVGRKLDAIA